jgi:hypothetical protein
MVQLLVKAARNGSEQTTGRTGNTHTKVTRAFGIVLSLSTVYPNEAANTSQTF